MCAAGAALEACAIAATGVSMRFAAGDDWLAVKLNDSALVKHVLLAQTVEEYHELVRLMEGDDSIWVQVGEDDWAADQDLAEAGAWGEALRLTHSPAGGVMSDVEEAPAWVVTTPRGDRMDARVHGMGDGLSMRSAVGEIPARVLFAGTARVGQDDLDKVLGGKGKLTSKWADSLDDVDNLGNDMDVSKDDAILVGEHLGRLGRCDGTCRKKFDAIEATLDRVAKMVEMLGAAGGLATPATRLVVEKHEGKMAREWDESVSQAKERAKAEVMVRAAEKRVRKNSEKEKRAEEGQVLKEKAVQVKEPTRLAAVTERDRMVEAARGCTDGVSGARDCLSLAYVS